MNKHNAITTTYYLLLKKQERETGKNIVFETVTKEKRSYNSTGNLCQTRPANMHNATFFRGNSEHLGNK